MMEYPNTGEAHTYNYMVGTTLGYPYSAAHSTQMGDFDITDGMNYGDYYAHHGEGFDVPGPLDNARVYTEQRRIIIRQLERRSLSRQQIHTLIRDHVGPDASDDILEMDIPRDGENATKGFAFVLFGSSDTAKRAVSSLDGLDFKGRTLEVRPTVEGVSVSEAASASVTSRPFQHPSRHRKDQNKEDVEEDRKGKGKSTHSRASSSRAGPSFSSTAGRPPPEKDGDKNKGSKKEAIVIVDGRSGRKPDDKKRT
jgi:hypothetical protein